MLVEVAFLGEAQVAVELVLVGALVGLLVSVHAQVVIKIMPLPVIHLAPLKITLEYFEVPLRAWVFVLIDAVPVRGWDVLRLVVLVVLGAIYDLYGYALFGDLSPYGHIFNAFPPNYLYFPFFLH